MPPLDRCREQTLGFEAMLPRAYCPVGQGQLSTRLSRLSGRPAMAGLGAFLLVPAAEAERPVSPSKAVLAVDG
jgi:hypothetical protein